MGSHIVGNGDKGFFMEADKSMLKKGRSESFRPKALSRYLGLYRNGVWSYPVHGTQLTEIPFEMQLLLWERTDNLHGLMIPLIGKDLRAWIAGGDEEIYLAWDGGLSGDEPESMKVAFVSWGENPLTLVESAMRKISATLNSFRLRNDKNKPDFIDYLGWCTWDAFYREVSASKVIDGLESFARGKLQPGFLMLDDGWQDADMERRTLRSPGVNDKKFPGGLAPLVRRVKSKYKIKKFGVWHALSGYWNGVEASGELGRKYPLVKKIKTFPSGENGAKNPAVELNLIAPESASRFFNDYHAALHRAGVDMIKVDYQSGLETFTADMLGRCSSMRLYQEGLQGAAQNYFLGNCINCMSNSSDVFFNMLSSNVMRSSNDYFPEKGVHEQQAHVFKNAMNVVWFSTFLIPDWDMFQSHGVCAEFHAAARALSGGPVYVCDSPDKQNFSIISKLVVSGSRVPLFDRPALPLPECVYVDACNTPNALKIFNYKKNIAVLGLFNCYCKDMPLKTAFSPIAVPELKGEKFAVYLHQSRELMILDANASHELELPSAGWELATLSPVNNGMAPLGMPEKYAGAATLADWSWLNSDLFVCKVIDGGRFLFYSERPPESVLCNSRETEFDYDRQNGKLEVKIPAGSSARIVIDFNSRIGSH